MSTPLLEVRNLEKYFLQDAGIINRLLGKKKGDIQAVDGVSLTIGDKETIGVIGESGCGKSTFLWTLMGLHDKTGGDIRYEGRSTDEFDRSDWKEYRRNVQIVFQNPFTALDPKMTVEESLREPLKIHGLENRKERIHDVLEDVELRPIERYVSKSPDELSGGEKQRVSIARGLILEPDLLLADEPLSMLDVSTQAAILNMLSRLSEERDFSMIYVSHDISTVSYLCDSIEVMYLGRIIESAPVSELLDDPKHPYTQALIQAIPVPDPHANRKRSELEYKPQTPVDLGEGCRFRERCPERMDICEKTPKRTGEDDHTVCCHLYYDHEETDSVETPLQEETR
jgi:peptide/nickel transport system ATP-binding protein